jgi:hypothetical protein
MLVASVSPAMAFNTFQFPVERDGEVVVPVEEPPGPPTASGGPRNFVFHCEEGGTEIIHTDAAGEDEDQKRMGKGECAPD